MSGLVLVAGLAAPLAVVVALAPDGARGRVSLRRHEPTRRPAARRPDRHAVVVRPLPTRLLARGGRAVRSLAGRPVDGAADIRVGLAVVAATAVAVVVSPLAAVPTAFACSAAPALRRRSRARAHERAVRSALPDAVDLFRLAVGSGLSVRQAVEAVAVRAPAPVDATLTEVVRRVGLGERLGDALDALDGLGDAALPLAAALRGAARHGAPLGDALERVAADARVLRRRRAEEDARRLPVQMLFPLVLCVLPAFGLLAVVPLLLASLRSLQL